MATLLEASTDPTGSMSQTDLNTQDIQNLIDAYNGMQSSTGNIINEPTYTEINDGTTNRALMGYNQTTGTWGIFAVPAGSDLGSATTPQQFAFSSDYPSLIVLGGAQTTTIAGASFTVSSSAQTTIKYTTVAHGLNYIPAVLAFAAINFYGNGGIITSGVVQLPMSGIETFEPVYQYAGTGSSLASPNIIYGVDTTNIYFTNVMTMPAYVGGSGTVTIPTITITYYLLTPTA